MAWTEEQDAALKFHLAGDMSFAQAAAAINHEFQTSYTRNATIGRANRTGLRSNCSKTGGLPRKRHVGPKPWEVEGISKRTYYRRKSGGPCRSNAVAPAKPMPDFQALRCVEVNPLNLDLLELESSMCRWPYGDGPYTFCGHPVFDGFSYCGVHLGLSLRAAA